MRSRVTAVMIAAAGPFAPPALAEPEVKYPLVFTSVADLEKLGLSQQWPIIYDTGIQNDTLPKPGLAIGCYLYAGPATRALISISEDFLTRYKAKGFSRESLCMGLASRAQYDPETGKRLPTYILRDEAVIDAALAKIDVDALTPDNLASFVPGIFETKDALKTGIEDLRRRDFAKLSTDQIEILMNTDTSILSDELPLKVPDCFKNGTPYLDCNWRYGLLTGKKLSAAAPKRYREVGETIDRHMQSLVKYKTWPTADIAPYLHKRVWGLMMDWTPDTPDSTWKYVPTHGAPLGETADGYNVVQEVNGGQPLEFQVANGLHHWAEEVTWFDVSPAFPRGYGYNLTEADEGFGDGAASAQSILATFGGTSSSARFSTERLLLLLN